MSAGKIDLHIEQGATLTKRFVKKRSGIPVDLSGYSAKMQIRADLDSESELITTITSDGTTTGITLGGSLGTIVLRIGADVTAAMDVPEDGGRLGYYDLFLIENGDPTERIRLLRGSVFITPMVTEV